MKALNLLGNSYYNILSIYDLLLFGLGVFTIVCFLMFYYKIISKSNSNSVFDSIFYNDYKDILLQEKITDGVYLAESKKVSVWTKLVVYIFIIIAITTPLYKLFGVQHFI